MRNDLSETFKQALVDGYRSPIQLMIIHFSFGNVYLSDRDIVIDGIQYLGLIEDWGTLSTPGYGTSDIIAETLEISISIWNGGNSPFSDYFLIDDPLNVSVTLQQTFVDLPSEDIATLGSFVIQDPLEWSESTRLLVLDLVSVNMRYIATVGDLITREDWPNLEDEQLGKGYDLLLGNPGAVSLVPVDPYKIATLNGVHSSTARNFAVKESLDDLGVPSSGSFVIDGYKIFYSSRTEFNLYRTTVTTPAKKHEGGSKLVFVSGTTKHVVGQGPIKHIYNIRANGEKNGAFATEYYVDFDESVIILETYNYRRTIYTRDGYTSFEEFDTVTALNTAYNASAVFKDSPNYAILTSSNPLLAINHDIVSSEFIDPSSVFNSFLYLEIYSNEEDSIRVTISIPEVGTYSSNDGVIKNITIKAKAVNILKVDTRSYSVRSYGVSVLYTGSSSTIDLRVNRIYHELNMVTTDHDYETEIVESFTCEVSGTEEVRPDQVIQRLLNERAGVPLSLFGSLTTDPLTFPSGAEFKVAAKRYDELGYRLDGIISANTSVSEAIKNICKQSRGRIVWSAGKVKLAVQEIVDLWEPVKDLVPKDLQLRSVNVSKDSAESIFNIINLFYNKEDFLEGTSTEDYSASVTRNDTESISKHGIRKNDDEWLFDLVRDKTMAEDLADYYLWKYGIPSTKYEITAYLPQLDIEKGDVLRLTSNFYHMGKLPVRVLNIIRAFGSGKLEKINTIQIIGEAIRHSLLLERIDDIVETSSELSIISDSETAFPDTFTTEEDIFFRDVFGYGTCGYGYCSYGT